MADVRRSRSFDKAFAKLWLRNPVLAEYIERKISHIAENPEHYKPLRGDMKGLRRVHFGSYILIYRFADDVVELIALDHHDVAYRR